MVAQSRRRILSRTYASWQPARTYHLGTKRNRFYFTIEVGLQNVNSRMFQTRFRDDYRVSRLSWSPHADGAFVLERYSSTGTRYDARFLADNIGTDTTDKIKPVRRRTRTLIGQPIGSHDNWHELCSFVDVGVVRGGQGGDLPPLQFLQYRFDPL